MLQANKGLESDFGLDAFGARPKLLNPLLATSANYRGVVTVRTPSALLSVRGVGLQWLLRVVLAFSGLR